MLSLPGWLVAGYIPGWFDDDDADDADDDDDDDERIYFNVA